MRRAYFVLAIPFVLICVFTVVASALDRTPTGFYYPIGTSNFNSECGTWLGRDINNGGCYEPSGVYHIGADMMTKNTDSPVYAISKGDIYDRNCKDDSWGPGNCALFIRHTTSSGQIFTALYGHLIKESLPVKNEVEPGQPIGRTGKYSGGIHLHFGIHPGSEVPYSNSSAGIGWGRMQNSQWPNTNGFINPVDFIKSNAPQTSATEQTTACIGNVCWEPRWVNCEDATSWYRLTTIPYANNADSGVCNEMYQAVETIVQAVDNNQEIPNDHWWQSWWRYLRGFFAEAASADDIRKFITVRTIKVADKTVSSGNGVTISDGTGHGVQTPATDSYGTALPDFIVEKLWLETKGGHEQYTFTTANEIKVRMKIKNIGDDDIPRGNELQTRVYISDGYKKDRSDDWIHAGTAKVDTWYLDPDKSVSQTIHVKLSDFSSVVPGNVYNIVGCTDRIHDEGNGIGAYAEKHENNNCSTEAVFTVTEPNYPPIGYVDIVPGQTDVCSVIPGWAKDQNAPDTSINVEIFQGDVYGNNQTKIATIPTSIYRGDGGINGLHGFSWTVPESLKTGAAYTLFFYAIDSSNNGSYSLIGKTGMICSAPERSFYPVYRAFYPGNQSYFYTTDESEKNRLSSSGWTMEGRPFYAYNLPQPGLVPVYRLLSNTGHFYTTDSYEKDALSANTATWIYEGIAFYGFPYQVNGTVSVYRLANPARGNHLWTPDPIEKSIAIALYGFVDEGVGWYTLQTPPAQPVAPSGVQMTQMTK